MSRSYRPRPIPWCMRRARFVKANDSQDCSVAGSEWECFGFRPPEMPAPVKSPGVKLLLKHYAEHLRSSKRAGSAVIKSNIQNLIRALSLYLAVCRVGFSVGVRGAWRIKALVPTRHRRPSSLPFRKTSFYRILKPTNSQTKHSARTQNQDPLLNPRNTTHPQSFTFLHPVVFFAVLPIFPTKPSRAILHTHQSPSSSATIAPTWRYSPFQFMISSNSSHF